MFYPDGSEWDPTWVKVGDGMPSPVNVVIGVCHRVSFATGKPYVTVEPVELRVGVDDGEAVYRWVDESGETPELGVTHFMNMPPPPHDFQYDKYWAMRAV